MSIEDWKDEHVILLTRAAWDGHCDFTLSHLRGWAHERLLEAGYFVTQDVRAGLYDLWHRTADGDVDALGGRKTLDAAYIAGLMLLEKQGSR